MNKIIYSFLFLIAGFVGHAQNSDKFNFEADFSVKVSLGDETRRTIQYTPGITVNIPARSIYSNLVYSMEVGVNYKIVSGVSIGLASGINVVKFDNHPVVADEYYDRVMFPLLLKAGYQRDMGKGWFYNLTLAGGHQFADFKFANTVDGFLFQEFGGVIGYANIGIGKAFGKYNPVFSLGYEINQFSHEDSIGWIEPLSYDDKVFYKTRYRFLRLSMRLKI